MITETKQWGNSIAVIIPNKRVKEMKLRPGEEVEIRIRRKTNVLKELFGSLKFSKPTEELLREARKNTSKWWDE